MSVHRAAELDTASPAPVWSAGRYDTVLGPLVVHLKERRRLTLLDPAATALAAAVASTPPCTATGPRRGPACVLVPVPSAPESVARRGFDHAVLLARRSGRKLCEAGLEVRCETFLRHRGGGTDQAGLGAAQRWANVQHAFLAHHALLAHEVGSAGRIPPVVLVDDVWTTGATARAAAAELGRAGAMPAAVAVVAAVGQPAWPAAGGLQDSGPGSRPEGVD